MIFVGDTGKSSGDLLVSDNVNLAPSFSEVVRAGGDGVLQVAPPSPHTFSPSAPPLSQKSLSLLGGGYGRCADGLLLPSAPPLSQDVSKSEMNSNTLNNVDDTDGFILVEKKKRKRKETVVGMKKNYANNVLRSARRIGDLYIGNCDLEVTPDTLSAYILAETGIEISACEMLETKSTVSRSFKVTLNMNDRKKLLNPDVWPEEILCRKFYKPRNQQS